MQAQKEGSEAVVEQLERVLRIAMEAKQATLRPEIQLLNNLLAAADAEARAQVRPRVKRGREAQQQLRARRSGGLPGARLAHRPAHPALQVLGTPAAEASLNEYFFQLLTRMTSDVQHQPDNPQKAALCTRLAAIAAEAQAAAAALQ